jgi:hypothetical protein
MQKLVIYGVIVVIVLLGLAALLFMGPRGHGSSNTITIQGSTTSLARGNSTGPLFSSESYYPYSYLIAPGNLSQQSKSALDGYTMTVSQTPAGENVTISLSGRSVVTSLVNGEKLYIVETSFGDDAPGFEGSTADDGFVVVDQNGYVVNTFAV